MQRYIEALRDYYRNHPPNYGGAENLLEFLYWHYSEDNPIDNQKIRDGFAKMRSQFPHLSLQEFDPIFTIVSGLCVECERLAFYEGLRLGAALMTELTEK